MFTGWTNVCNVVLERHLELTISVAFTVFLSRVFKGPDVF